MFKKDKYFGEIWLPEQENHRFFCELEIVNKRVILSTNLSSNIPEYKKTLVYGVFNDLGCMTFVNCTMQQSVDGLISFRKYSPDFVFSCSEHFIEPKNLRVKNVLIENEFINDFIGTVHIYNPVKDTIEKHNSLTHEVELGDGVVLSLIKNFEYYTDKNKLSINNKGFVGFEFREERSILQVIGYYKQFQKFCITFLSGINEFSFFRCKCIECNTSFSIYFNDNLAVKHYYSVLNARTFELDDEFNKVIFNWYNNDDLKFCIDIIIENFLSVKVSHSRRFTNSISSLEAVSKNFVNKKNSKLNVMIDDLRGMFDKLTDNTIADFKYFNSKIIQTRKNYVHANPRIGSVFEGIELLYISILIDYVVLYKISEQLGFTEEVLKQIIRKGQSDFIDGQRVNKMLNHIDLID